MRPIPEALAKRQHVELQALFSRTVAVSGAAVHFDERCGAPVVEPKPRPTIFRGKNSGSRRILLRGAGPRDNPGRLEASAMNSPFGKVCMARNPAQGTGWSWLPGHASSRVGRPSTAGGGPPRTPQRRSPWPIAGTAALLVACGASSSAPGRVDVPPTSLGTERPRLPRCDGTHDDTAAIQALVDRARAADGIGRGIRLPAGVCGISDTIRIHGVVGFTLSGAGPMATRLRWSGPEDRPAVLFAKALRGSARELTIETAPGHTLDTAIQIQQGPDCDGEAGCSDANFSSGVFLDRIHVRGQRRIVNGIRVALYSQDQDRVNDRHRFQNIHVALVTGYGFVLEGMNAKQILLSGVSCSGGRVTRACVTTATVAGHSAAFQWHGGMSTGMVEADFIIGGCNDTLMIQGLYSEKSTRFLLVQDGEGELHRNMPYPTVIEGVRWASGPFTAEDGEIVRFRSIGPLSIRSSSFGRNAPPSPIRFVFAPQTASGAEFPGGFAFEGNYVGATNADIFPAAGPTFMHSNMARIGNDLGPMANIGDVVVRRRDAQRAVEEEPRPSRTGRRPRRARPARPRSDPDVGTGRR